MSFLINLYYAIITNGSWLLIVLILEFQVALAVQEICQKHLHNNMVATLKPITVKTNSPLESQAFEVFTPFAFKKFQDELMASSQYSINHEEGNVFIVRFFEGDSSINRRVVWDGTTLFCSCKNFEFWGILCRHIFRVLLHNDCFKIPFFYLPQRWHCDRLQNSISDLEVQNTIDNQEVTRENIIAEAEFEIVSHEISNNGVDVLCPPKSKTKGRPPKKRERSGKDLGKKKTKCCSMCKQHGHTKPTCLNKENMFSLNNFNETTALTSQNKQKKMADDLGLNPIFTFKY
jgi:SWIM zinc finger